MKKYLLIEIHLGLISGTMSIQMPHCCCVKAIKYSNTELLTTGGPLINIFVSKSRWYDISLTGVSWHSAICSFGMIHADLTLLTQNGYKISLQTSRFSSVRQGKCILS